MGGLSLRSRLSVQLPFVCSRKLVPTLDALTVTQTVLTLPAEVELRSKQLKIQN